MHAARVAKAAARLERHGIMPFYHSNVNRALSTLGTTGMPVLQAVVDRHVEAQPLKNVVIVAAQHTLKTTEPALKALLALGTRRIIVTGKSHSESDATAGILKGMSGVTYISPRAPSRRGEFEAVFERTVSTLWDEAERYLATPDALGVQKVVILDHGGKVTRYAPDLPVPITAVEKTTAGISLDISNFPFARVVMANSAIKRGLESSYIAKGVTERLSQELMPEIYNKRGLKCAVIGMGAIGYALANRLVLLGHRVFAYDIDPARLKNLPKGMMPVKNMAAAVAYSQVLFGCTGTDITAGNNMDLFSLADTDRVLGSASSGEVEFLTLVRAIQEKINKRVARPTETAFYETSMDATVKVLAGGFPLNLSDGIEREAEFEIDFTRAMGVEAAVQAAKVGLTARGDIMFDPTVQLQLARDFIASLKEHSPSYPNLAAAEKIFSGPGAIEWIKTHSGGTLEGAAETLAFEYG